jgi:hypothetical protein
VDIKPRDKLRITAGPSRGERAIVERIDAKNLLVRLIATDKLVPVKSGEITNFSAAARKAWKTMPGRKVGRPKGRTINRISVTLRINRSIWNRFKELESAGAIADRSHFLETILERELSRLEANSK